jgi:sortase (surface protein transpeptidase)
MTNEMRVRPKFLVLVTIIYVMSLLGGQRKASATATSKTYLANFYVGATSVIAQKDGDVTKTVTLAFGGAPQSVTPGSYTLRDQTLKGDILGKVTTQPETVSAVIGSSRQPKIATTALSPRQAGTIAIANYFSDSEPVMVKLGTNATQKVAPGTFVITGPITANPKLDVQSLKPAFTILTGKVSVPERQFAIVWLIGGGDRGPSFTVWYLDAAPPPTTIAPTSATTTVGTSAPATTTVPKPTAATTCANFPEVQVINTGIPASSVNLGTDQTTAPGRSGSVFELTIESLALNNMVYRSEALVQGNLTVSPTKWNEIQWYTGSQQPGDPGATLVIAHVNWNKRPGPFTDIGIRNKPVIGAPILITANGRTLTYRVTNRQKILKTEFSGSTLCQRSTAPVLFLVTCGGTIRKDPIDNKMHYDSNIIVTAVLETK